MINRFRQLASSRFVRNVAIVASGTAGAQAIAMVWAPVITRLYGPEAFGLLGTFMAVLAVLTPVAALTYPIAIVLPRSDAEASGIAKLSAVVAVILAAIVACLAVVSGDWFARALNVESIASFLILVPVAMLFSAFQQIFTQWIIRNRQFKTTAKVAVTQAVLINLMKTSVGLLYPNGAVLIVISSIGQVLHAVLLWSGVKKSKTKITGAASKWKEIRELATRHRDFPLYRAPQVALNALSQSLPIFMLASFFGPAAAGFYTLSKSVLGLPSTLIGKSVADVFYPRVTNAAHNGEDLSKLILKATSAMAIVGALPFGVVALFGPVLFSFVFGSSWDMAGEYARWLSLWLYFAFLNRPSVAAVATLRLQKFFLCYEVSTAVLRAAALFIGFWIFRSDVVAVALFSIAGVISNAALIVVTLYKAKR